MKNVVHCKQAAHDVYVGRGSMWGNPYTHIKNKKTMAKHIVADREAAIRSYWEHLKSQLRSGEVTLD